jgi:ubiquinone/menaquinone biosynthesis C-methylase UbiE
LPFPDGYFDLIVISSTLEFVRDKDRVLSECARTLSSKGTLYIQTVNRYSIGRDPYTYLWGVGFLPRAWQPAYVQWRRKAVYSHIKTLSLRELHRLTAKHFMHREIALPDIDKSALSHFSFSTRLQIRTYKAIRAKPVVKSILAAVGAGWEIILRKNVRA